MVQWCVPPGQAQPIFCVQLALTHGPTPKQPNHRTQHKTTHTLTQTTTGHVEQTDVNTTNGHVTFFLASYSFLAAPSSFFPLWRVPSHLLFASEGKKEEQEMRGLKDKIAVVTASTEGSGIFEHLTTTLPKMKKKLTPCQILSVRYRIGYAIVERLLEEGSKVVISSRKQENVSKALKTLAAKGFGDDKVLGLVCHSANKEHVYVQHRSKSGSSL